MAPETIMFWTVAVEASEYRFAHGRDNTGPFVFDGNQDLTAAPGGVDPNQSVGGRKGHGVVQQILYDARKL